MGCANCAAAVEWLPELLLLGREIRLTEICVDWGIGAILHEEARHKAWALREFARNRALVSDYCGNPIRCMMSAYRGSERYGSNTG
jgi:hypothetical protein